jgi:hypothetical protein
VAAKIEREGDGQGGRRPRGGGEVGGVRREAARVWEG